MNVEGVVELVNLSNERLLVLRMLLGHHCENLVVLVLIVGVCRQFRNQSRPFFPFTSVPIVNAS